MCFNFYVFSVSLKDKMLNIHAKMDRKSDDGSRFYQEISREYLLPDTLKTEELKSIFTDDGVYYMLHISKFLI